MKLFLFNWGLVIISALFDTYAGFIVKHKFNKLGKIDFSSWDSFANYMLVFIKDPLLITALITFVCAPGVWFIALNRLEYSIAYPVLVGFHLLFVLIMSIMFLDEAISVNKLIGCGLILLSLYFFSK